jgi:hypothetical protein
MKDAIINAALLGAAVVLAHEARAQQPAPTIPASALPAPLPPMAPRPAAPAPAPKPPTIKLGQTHNEIQPIEHGIGNAEGEEIVVKANGGTLTATLGAASNAYGYVFHHSTGTANVRVVQEFEVIAGSPSNPHVTLALGGQIGGYIRANTQGSACLRMAASAIVPVGGGPPLTGFVLPSFCTPGCGIWPVDEEATAPIVTVPAGCYLLVADLVLDATADGFNRGHGEAAFSPTALEGIWSPPDAPANGYNRKNFGFIINLKAAAAR